MEARIRRFPHLTPHVQRLHRQRYLYLSHSLSHGRVQRLLDRRYLGFDLVCLGLRYRTQ